MTTPPDSKLTKDRPDIWQCGIDLAMGLTGYVYEPKIPGPDGVILACGFYNPSYVPYKEPSAEERKRSRIKELDVNIDVWRRSIVDHRDQIAELQEKIKEAEKEKAGLLASPRVFVPEGAMEWLLHEVGHWVAATPEERSLPNYGIPVDTAYDDKTQIKTAGFGYDREWQAWAFEEIVLAPFGPSREFISPSCAGGVGFSKHQIPSSAFTHIEQKLRDQRIDLDPLRKAWGAWIEWGRMRGDRAPWKM